MTRCLGEKIDEETEKLIVGPENKRKKSLRALEKLNQEAVARALAYACYTSFLISSIIWIVMHATALALQRDKMLAVKKDMLLAGYCTTIISYLLHSSCVAIYIAKVGGKGLRKEKVRSVGIAASLSESVTALTVTLMSIKMIFTAEQSTVLVPILGGVASLFSMASSAALLCSLGRKCDVYARPQHYKVQMSRLVLAMLLSATNVCLVVSSLIPAAEMPYVAKETVQLMISVGWTLAFIGAIMLMRFTPHERRLQASPPSNFVDTTPGCTPPKNMFGDVCNEITGNNVSM